MKFLNLISLVSITTCLPCARDEHNETKPRIDCGPGQVLRIRGSLQYCTLSDDEMSSSESSSLIPPPPPPSPLAPLDDPEDLFSLPKPSAVQGKRINGGYQCPVGTTIVQSSGSKSYCGEV